MYFFYKIVRPWTRGFVYLVLRRLSNLDRFLEISASPRSDLDDEAHRCRKYTTRGHYIDGVLGRPWNAVHHTVYVIANRKPRTFCGFNGSFERNEVCRVAPVVRIGFLAILIPIGARDLFTRYFPSLSTKFLHHSENILDFYQLDMFTREKKRRQDSFTVNF